ncbi:hypothetical protein VTK26DRAFT_9526 [Humicola hyalothermophila]
MFLLPCGLRQTFLFEVTLCEERISVSQKRRARFPEVFFRFACSVPIGQVFPGRETGNKAWTDNPIPIFKAMGEHGYAVLRFVFGSCMIGFEKDQDGPGHVSSS